MNYIAIFFYLGGGGAGSRLSFEKLPLLFLINQCCRIVTKKEVQKDKDVCDRNLNLSSSDED